MRRQKYNPKKKKTIANFKSVSLWNATKTQTQKNNHKSQGYQFVQRKKIRANVKNTANPDVAKLTQAQKKKNKTLQTRFKNI
jgi:hypothetical protein